VTRTSVYVFIRKLLGGLVFGALAAGLPLPSFAGLSLPTTGVCAFVATTDYPFAYIWGTSPGTGWGLTLLGAIDFGASMITFNLVTQNPNANPNLATEAQQSASSAFTTAAGPITGSYTISFNVSSNALSFNLIPVNNGNTILMQDFNLTAGDQGGGRIAECHMQYFNAKGNSTASGYEALFANTTGTNNSAYGYQALYSNTTGSGGTASGVSALANNTTGNRNNAAGGYALFTNTTANDNNAIGYFALYHNTSGTLNNAMGNFALEFNTTGFNNNAVGYGSMLNNTTGADNSGQGYFSLENNTSGNLNVGVGYKAGSNLTTGSNNIDIGNAGVAAESGIIRIGTPGTQSAAFVAAISGTNISGGAAVVVSSSGQLGVVSSSRRYKQDIAPMGEASERLYQLQPVTFRYKKSDPDGSKPLQTGLIAEDVAAVMPELVVYNDAGQPESVAYHLLPTLLLNELQKEHQRLTAMTAQVAEIDSLRAEVAELRKQTTQLLAQRVAGGADLEPIAEVARVN
jgi:hypothetical protein